MGCVILRQGQYTFDASAGTVTLLNMHIEPQQLTAIYRILNNGGATAKVALYQGLDPKGGDVTIAGDDTLVTLDFDTTSFDDGDTLRIDLSVDGEMLFNKQQIVANGVTDGTAVFNSEDIKSMVLFVKSDENILVNYNRYSEQNGGGVNTPVVFPLDALETNQGATPKFFRASFGVNDPSFSFTFTNNSGGNADVTFYVLGLFERLETTILPLSFPLTRALALPHVANVNKGFDRNGFTRDVGVTENRHLQVSDTDETIEIDTFEISGALPSGATPTYDPANPIVATNVRDTFWLDMDEFKNQFWHSIFDIQGVKIFLINAYDELGNGSQTMNFDFPTLISNGGMQSEQVGAPFFSRYFRIIVFNDTGLTANGYGWRSRASNLQASPIYISLNQTLLGNFPAPLQQTVVKAQDDITGFFQAIESHKGNVTTSLAVHIGNRTSEVAGRIAVRASLTLTGLVTPIGGTVYTPALGNKLFVTHFSRNLVNILNGVGGDVDIEDGLGSPFWAYPITPATNQSKTGFTGDPTFENNPLPIDNDLSATLPAGLVGSTFIINILGYEESI